MQKVLLFSIFFLMQNILSEKSCLIILGHAGAGKDTLCEQLEKKNYVTFNAGEEFKKELQKNNEIKSQQNNLHKKTGAYSPEAVWELIQAPLEDFVNKKSTHIIINGFPRDPELVNKVYALILKFTEIKIIALIADAETRWERIEKRSEESKQKRFDDTKESFVKRTTADEGKIPKILQEFKKLNVEIVEIDTTNKDPEIVFNEVCSHLDLKN